MIGKVQVRYALDEDGPRIGELAALCGAPGLDWSRVAPYWLVALLDDEIVGALQMLYGYPLARIDFLWIDPALGRRERALVTRDITDFAIVMLHAGGCEIVASSIDSSLKSYLRVAAGRGWSLVGETITVMRRLR